MLVIIVLLKIINSILSHLVILIMLIVRLLMNLFIIIMLIIIVMVMSIVIHTQIFLNILVVLFWLIVVIFRSAFIKLIIFSLDCAPDIWSNSIYCASLLFRINFSNLIIIIILRAMSTYLSFLKCSIFDFISYYLMATQIIFIIVINFNVLLINTEICFFFVGFYYPPLHLLIRIIIILRSWLRTSS